MCGTLDINVGNTLQYFLVTLTDRNMDLNYVFKVEVQKKIEHLS